jgi:hypothetical protein
MSGSFTREIQLPGNPFLGKWTGNDGSIVTVYETTWSRTGGSSSDDDSGTYTYIGNTAAYKRNNSSSVHTTRIINGQFHTRGLTFSSA